MSPETSLELETSLETEKRVRILCDYGAEGVWNKAGESCCLDELPVSEDLLARMEAWQEDYSSAVDLVFEAENGPDYTIMRQGIFMRSVEGLAIARAVKATLPDWQVIYFDEEKWQNYRDANRDLTFISEEARSSFEYPITLDEPGTEPE